MINQIQKQRCIWPVGSAFGAETVRASRWDKVIGLIPQSSCLVKVFHYKDDLIAYKDIAQCIENELSALVDWSELGSYLWISKTSGTWQVAVWFWDDGQITFSQEITHKIPAMVYQLGCIQNESGLFVYTEKQQDSSKLSSWAVTWSNNRVIENFYPLSSLIHAKSITHLVESKEFPFYANHEQCPIVTDVIRNEMKSLPKTSVLSAAKCSGQIDIDNPWLYWRGMLMFVSLVCIYIALDAALVRYQSDNSQRKVTEMQQQTLRTVNQIADFNDRSKFLNAVFQAQSRQQAPAKMIDSLILTLAKDIVIKNFSYQDNKVLLQGTIQDTNGLVNALLDLPEVSDASLLGEVVPTNDGRQEFKVELTLKDPYIWKK